MIDLAPPPPCYDLPYSFPSSRPPPSPSHSDCWFPGCAVVYKHPGLPVLGLHPPAHAGVPAGAVRLHVALPHQPLKDLLLQVTLLAPQTAGQPTHMLCY